MHYNDEKNLKKSAELFSQHTDCHLFARDKLTFYAFQQFTDKVQLLPDMAHQLYGLLPIRNNKPTEKFEELYFLRRDIETSPDQKDLITKLPQGSHIYDWEDFCFSRDDIILALTWRTASFAKKYKLHWLKNKISRFWLSYTKKLIQRMAKEFLCYNHITSSRLHGHIFACLLEIPNTVLDNSYGKNTRYTELWTKDISFQK